MQNISSSDAVFKNFKSFPISSTKVEDEYEFNKMCNSAGKPKRTLSSPSVRIQVTIHRSLTWKTSSDSGPGSSKIQLNDKNDKWVNVALNGTHIGVVQPPSNDQESFVFEVPIQPFDLIKRKRSKRQRYRSFQRQNKSDINILSSSKSDTDHGKSVRIRLRESSSSGKKKRITPINSSRKEEPILHSCSSLEEIQTLEKEKQNHQSFTFPIRRRHAVLPEELLHPAMTCFTEPGLHVNNTENSLMGANGSTFPSGVSQGQRRGGRLKLRSQSSSALHCMKSSNNNGFQSSTECDYSKEGEAHAQYYNINGSSGNHYVTGPNGLSSSIPADLWDLPPNSQSFSPSRHRRKSGKSHGTDSVQTTRRNRFIQMPVVEALINLSRKGGRKSSTGRRAGPESYKVNNRANLYAASSCPDVTQHTHESFSPGKREYGDENNSDLRASQPFLHSQQYNNSGNSSGLVQTHRTSCPHHPQHKRRQESWRSEQERQKQCRSREELLPYLHQSAMSLSYPAFPFISEDNIFEVSIVRDQRGLGLGFSVSGGADSKEPYAGLIRVKKVFPMGPAFESGRLRPWDLILKANGISLIGLTNHEALEVLRTTPTETKLTVCRPPPLPGLYSTEAGFGGSQSQLSSTQCSQHHHRPVLTHRNSIDSGPSSYRPENHNHTQRLSSLADSFSSVSSYKSKSLSSLKIPSTPSANKKANGEFEVTLDKIGGSLGFTLRQDDTSVLSHYVRDLVKPPALGDGRIQPGDRILSVNSQDLEGMNHADAVAFLRQCPTRVKLRLYRDVSPTPISLLSPAESHRVVVKDKIYRKEAIEMIQELKERKQMSASPDIKGGSNGSGATTSTGLSRGYKQPQIDANGTSTLPRRLPGHMGMTPSPEVISAALDRFAGRSTPKSNQSPELSRLKGKIIGSGVPSSGKSSCPSEARSSGSGESTPAGTIIHQKRKSERNDLSEVKVESQGLRKPSFRQYTMHLDRISSLEDESFSSDLNQNDSIVSAPGLGSDGKNFRHGQPAYQSALLPATRGKTRTKMKNLSLSREEIEQYGQQEWRLGPNSRIGGDNSPTEETHSLVNWSPPLTAQQKDPSNQKGESTDYNSGAESRGLSKWKGVLFTGDEDDPEEEEDDEDNLDSLDGSLPGRDPAVGESDGPPASALSSISKKSSFLQVESGGKLSQRQSPDGREFHEGEMNMIEVSSSNELFTGEQILTVQLSRKWCSRLGFSIKGTNGHTFITAIYEDSVAARDGRLHVGDEVIMVNNRPILNMDTSEVIDLMRKTRGIITIALLRKPKPLTAETCYK